MAMYATEAAPPPCWSCGAVGTPVGSSVFSCFECHAILPVDDRRCKFSLFQMEPAVVVDVAILEKRFRDLQKRLHPDKFSTKSKREQDISSSSSALVNVAYQTLRNPMERLKYVLSEAGIGVLSETSGSFGDPNLLMEIMELREQVESSRDTMELQGLQSMNQLEINATLEALNRHFEAREDASLGEASVRLQYLTKLDEEIDEAMGRLAESPGRQ